MTLTQALVILALIVAAGLLSAASPGHIAAWALAVGAVLLTIRWTGVEEPSNSMRRDNIGQK